MEIRDVRPEDIGCIEKIERLCFSLPWTEDMLKGQLKPNHVFLCAWEEGRLVGYVGLMYVLDEGYISNVAVELEFRRRGVARALLAELEKRARGLELAFTTLEVRQSNAPAIALYEKMGYSRVGIRKSYYEKPAEDAIIMTLELKRNGI